MDFKNLTDTELCQALRAHICWQTSWCRKLEKVVYMNEGETPSFASIAQHWIWEHQVRIDAVETEMERRQRVKFFKSLYDNILSYEANLQ
jgi:hypothetical protein